MNDHISRDSNKSHRDEIYEDDIDWIDLFKVIWKNRLLLLGFTLAFTIGAMAIAFLQDNIFRAEAIVVPAENGQSGGPLAGQLGAAATLVGIDIGEDNSRVSNAIAILKSRGFALQFLNKHDLLPSLMASVWSEEEGKLLINPASYDPMSKTWITKKPSEWQAFREFSKIFSVVEDRQGGLIRISIDWRDPAQAAEWVNWIVEDINQHVKARDLDEANSAIEYLRNQLLSTQLLEMQRVFYQLIESQTRIVMLADVRDEYVFQIIDPAAVSEQPIRPRRAVIILLGFCIGLILSMITVVARHYVQSAKS